MRSVALDYSSQSMRTLDVGLGVHKYIIAYICVRLILHLASCLRPAAVESWRGTSFLLLNFTTAYKQAKNVDVVWYGDSIPACCAALD
jgi:hypothetical protein